jgi:Peptidase A4 family
MSLTSLMRPRIGTAALLSGAAVWLALGPGNAGAASTEAGSPGTSRSASTAAEVGTAPRGTAGVRIRPDVGSANVSSNWAGYAVAGPVPASGAAVSYRAVSGTWVQPTATCTPGKATYSAFWVGLGGFAETSPGRIRNLTRGTTFTKRLTTTAPDVSAAEWVAEAPSACNGAGRCQVLPLTNFGTVSFSQAAAATVDGQSGTISSPAWAATPIQLVTDPVVGSGAAPGALAPDGSGFSVSWQG